MMDCDDLVRCLEPAKIDNETKTKLSEQIKIAQINVTAAEKNLALKREQLQSLLNKLNGNGKAGSLSFLNKQMRAMVSIAT